MMLIIFNYPLSLRSALQENWLTNAWLIMSPLETETRLLFDHSAFFCPVEIGRSFI